MPCLTRIEGDNVRVLLTKILTVVLFETGHIISIGQYKWSNVNWRDVQIKNVVNNVDMSSLGAPWQNGPYKKLTQRTTQKHVQHHDATDI